MGEKTFWLLSFILFSLLFPPLTHGQQGGSPMEEKLSLEKAVAEALAHNRQIRNARLEVEKSGDQIAAARRHFLPTFDVKLSESYLLTPSDYVFRQGVFGTYPGTGPVPANEVKISTSRPWNTFLSATVAQPLSQIYRLRLNVSALEIGRNMVQEKLRAQRQTVISEVKRSYWGILQAQNGIEANRQQTAALRELERVAGEQVKQQAVLEADLLDLRARLARLEYEALTLTHAIATGKQQLNALLGRDPGRSFTLDPDPRVPFPGIDPQEAQTLAYERRPELKEVQFKRRQAEYEIRIKKAEYIPDINLIFNYLSPFDSEFLPRNLATVGLQLSWDFFDWGRKQRELNERHRTLTQVQNEIKETETQILIEVQSRLQKLKETEALTRAARLAKEASKERLRVTMNRYRIQAALLQEVLQIQAALAEADQQYQNAMLAYWTAWADFEKAIGEER